MYIAIYQPRVSYYIGGGEVVPLEHAKFLTRAGHRVAIVTSRANFISPSTYFLQFIKENPRVKIIYLDLPVALKWIYKEKPGTRWIRWDYESLHVGRLAFNYFLKNEFDIIAVHNYLDLIAIPPGQKSVLHLHGYPNQSNYLHELLSHIPNVFISVSKLIKEKWLQLVPINKIQVATNGIDASYFTAQRRESFQYDVLYVGRLIKTKGLSYLINAINLLKDLPLRVAIVGIGPEEKTLKIQVKKLKLTHKVKFLGYVKTKNLPHLYNFSLMGVFPSYDREGILTTMLENAACGRPTITTTACSMSEFLRNGYNGLLVKPKDDQGLADAIKQIYFDQKLANKLGSQARESIEAFWNWPKKIKEIEKIYATTLTHH